MWLEVGIFCTHSPMVNKEWVQRQVVQECSLRLISQSVASRRVP